MSTRKHSETSKAAYDSLTLSDVKRMHLKIIEALKVIGLGHTEHIADHLTLPHAKVHKRISELERQGKVFKPGGKSPMKSGRMAFLWQLTSEESPKTDKEVQYKPTEKTAADYANQIINTTQQLTFFE